MPIIRLNRNDGTCRISKDGIVKSPKEVIARLGWANRARIRIAYIESPLLLLFDVGNGSEEGVELRYTSPISASGSGAAIKSRPMSKIIALNSLLPRSGIPPIYPTNGLADLALMVEEPKWVPFQFDKNGCQDLPKKSAVYEFRDNRETIRVGEGMLPDRMRDHMSNIQLASEVRSARYFLVKDKEESEAFEHVLLCSYAESMGRLPRHNAIKA